jgi:hypothetical protein
LILWRRSARHGLALRAGLALAVLISATTSPVRADIAPPLRTRSVLPFPRASVDEADAGTPLMAPETDIMAGPLPDAPVGVRAESVLVEVDLFPTFARARTCLDLVSDAAKRSRLEIGFPEGWTKPLRGFRVAVDGEPVDVRTIGEEPVDPRDAYEIRNRSTRSDAPFWKVWRVDFPAGAVRTIEIEYLHLHERWRPYATEGYGDLDYLLTTASLWSGSVGELLVEIRLFDTYPDKVSAYWNRQPADPRCRRSFLEPDDGDCPMSLSEPELMANRRQTLYDMTWFAQDVEPEENLSVRIRSEIYRPDWWGPWDASFPAERLIDGPVRLLAQLGRFVRLEHHDEQSVSSLIELLERDARSPDPCLARPARELMLALRNHCNYMEGVPEWLVPDSDGKASRPLKERICRWDLEMRAGDPPTAASCPLSDSGAFTLGEISLSEHVQPIVLGRYVAGTAIAACALLALIAVLVVRKLRRRSSTR